MLAGLQDLTFEFGARTIVKNATWHIQPNERIGLIGYNGTGKSTLLKLFVNEYSPSAGTVEKSKSTSIGYLHQDLLSFDTNDSIHQVALSAFEPILNLEKEIEEIGNQLEKLTSHDTPESEELLHLYSDKLHEMDTLDGYSIHFRTEEILQGLGFANADLNRPYKEFSGGWRMRVLLAKMILQEPDLLLMDEPTNHLDLPSIEWLEKYLQHYKGSVVIVSHDKFFLNRMVTKIVEVYQEELHFYNGNYDFYEQEKELRVELQQRAFENQKDYIRQQERFIERFKAKASKAAAAQSAMKRLDKMDRIEDVKIERPSIKINFRIDKVPGVILTELNNVSKSFGNNVILKNAKAEITRGDKIALIGANGKGKSTLLRVIAGVEKIEGERKWGHNVDESFYAQHQLEAMNANNSIIEEMMTCGSQKTELELRTLLGCFLFSGDVVDKKIKILSGGEKARVALAKTIVSKANFLLLDEPTNHLDMFSCELLVEALNKYEGSLVLVSHDRYFISKVANKIWEIDDHKIREFKGSYEEWVDWKARKLETDKQNAQKEKIDVEKPVVIEKKAEPLKQAPVVIDKDQKKELQKLQKAFSQIEEKIAKLNENKSKTEASMGDATIYSDKNKFQETEKEYNRIAAELKILHVEYERAFEKMMELESEQKIH